MKNQFPKNTGYIPSRRVTSDKKLYSSSMIPPPKSITDVSMIPVLMQNQTPTCVLHAITFYIMWLVYKSTGKVVLLSPRFLSIMYTQKTGQIPVNGTMISIALDIAKEFGVCEDSLLPNNTKLDLKSYCDSSVLTDEIKQNALKYRISNYYFLNDLSENGFKQALAEWDLLLYGIDISDHWWTPSWAASDILPIKPPHGMSDPTLGRHLICGFGYDETPFDYFRNSFGPTWGFAGNGWFGSDDIPYVYEAAVIEGLNPPPPPPPVITPISPSSKPTNSKKNWFQKFLDFLNYIITHISN